MMGLQPSPEPITKKKLLAVEGNDEKSFFKELFKYMGMDAIVQVLDVAGKDNFKKEMPLLKKATGFNDLEAIGIIRDADDSFENAFKSVINVLEKIEDLKVPKKPGEFSQGNPKVGVFIMPDNSHPGMLEDLCLETVKDTEEMKCVKQFLDCAKQLENPPKEKDIPKAQVQTFLAVMPDVPNSVGRGAQKKLWNFDAAELKPLKDFLSQLK